MGPWFCCCYRPPFPIYLASGKWGKMFFDYFFRRLFRKKKQIYVLSSISSIKRFHFKTTLKKAVLLHFFFFSTQKLSVIFPVKPPFCAFLKFALKRLNYDLYLCAQLRNFRSFLHACGLALWQSAPMPDMMWL